jgi:hypothetical protein
LFRDSRKKEEEEEEKRVLQGNHQFVPVVLNNGKESWGENKEKLGTMILLSSAQRGASDRSTATCSSFSHNFAAMAPVFTPKATLYDRMLIYKQRGFTNPAPKVRSVTSPPRHAH